MAYPTVKQLSETIGDSTPENIKILQAILDEAITIIETSTGRYFGYIGTPSTAREVNDEYLDLTGSTTALSNMDIVAIQSIQLNGSNLSEDAYTLEHETGIIQLPGSGQLKISYSYGRDCPEDIRRAIYSLCTEMFSKFKQKTGATIASIRAGEFSVNYQALSGYTDKEDAVFSNTLRAYRIQRL